VLCAENPLGSDLVKIDKKKPKHWFYLVLFVVYVVVGICVRWIKGATANSVTLYGHKLNGNLRALYVYIKVNETGLSAEYLTLDPLHHRDLCAAGEKCRSALSVKDVIAVCRSACIVTDHGPHALVLLNKLSSAVFVDVWHGIPFKGYDAKDFTWLHGYRATFVPSPSMKCIYEHRNGFRPEQIFVTGYGRTARLVSEAYDGSEIKERLQIDEGSGKIVLFAPTWSHGVRDETNTPFRMSEEEFFARLNDFGLIHGCLILFRTHLNSEVIGVHNVPQIKFVPISTYLDTEGLLYISDVLVSDWSSIVFDYLVLHRPTVFIDIDAPFDKGFSYGPEYRFGPIVDDLDSLLQAIGEACATPDKVLGRYGEKMAAVATEVYANYADGLATKRYVETLKGLL